MRYDAKTYNCLHFVVDRYKALTGVDIGLFMDDLADNREIVPSKLKRLRRVDAPSSPCIAVMRGIEPHAGVYHNGQILHLNEQGVHCQPPHIAEIQHGAIHYYVVD